MLDFPSHRSTTTAAGLVLIVDVASRGDSGVADTSAASAVLLLVGHHRVVVHACLSSHAGVMSRGDMVAATDLEVTLS